MTLCKLKGAIYKLDF